jgi:hypothetical protein
MRIRWIVSVLTILIATALFAHDPQTITIKAAQKKQPPVVFAHGKHSGTLVKQCDTCHHTQKGLTEKTATATSVVKCTVCHLDPKKPNIPSMREMSLTKNPFHIRCIGCHKTTTAAKKGPTVCTGCHKKA